MTLRNTYQPLISRKKQIQSIVDVMKRRLDLEHKCIASLKEQIALTPYSLLGSTDVHLRTAVLKLYDSLKAEEELHQRELAASRLNSQIEHLQEELNNWLKELAKELHSLSKDRERCYILQDSTHDILRNALVTPSPVSALFRRNKTYPQESFKEAALKSALQYRVQVSQTNHRITAFISKPRNKSLNGYQSIIEVLKTTLTLYSNQTTDLGLSLTKQASELQATVYDISSLVSMKDLQNRCDHSDQELLNEDEYDDRLVPVQFFNHFPLTEGYPAQPVSMIFGQSLTYIFDRADQDKIARSHFNMLGLNDMAPLASRGLKISLTSNLTWDCYEWMSQVESIPGFARLISPNDSSDYQKCWTGLLFYLQLLPERPITMINMDRINQHYEFLQKVYKEEWDPKSILLKNWNNLYDGAKTIFLAIRETAFYQFIRLLLPYLVIYGTVISPSNCQEVISRLVDLPKPEATGTPFEEIIVLILLLSHDNFEREYQEDTIVEAEPIVFEQFLDELIAII